MRVEARGFLGVLAMLVMVVIAAWSVGCGGDAPAGGDTLQADVADVIADASVEDTADTWVPDSITPLDTVDVSPVDTLEPMDVASDATLDAASDATPDAMEPVVPLAGFGAISGACGVLDDELYDSEPSLFVNAIDFADDPYDAEDFDLLTSAGQEVLTDGNAGGSSAFSEVFAMEVLARCELAELIATETEIVYDVQGKLTDILVRIDGELVGVSVTRAVGFPKDAPYTVEQATTLLEDKLADVLASTANVSDEHRWVKQILHVLAYADGHRASVEAAWAAIDDDVRADTIVIVTVTDGDDLFMY